MQKIDLNQELIEHFETTKELLADAIDDTEIPLNQKAQTVNALAALLKQLADNQKQLYGAERIRLIEKTLVETLKEFPELAEPFMARYEAALSLLEI